MNFDLKEIVANFNIDGSLVSAAACGNGHINDTFAVVLKHRGRQVRYIIQRINHDVFTDPVSLMDNFKRVTQHLQFKLKNEPDAGRRSLNLIPTRNCFRDSHGNYWRCCYFIEKATTYDVVEKPAQAFQAAKAFGRFQRDLVDLPGRRLYETIPGFHNTPKRFLNLTHAVDLDRYNRAASAKAEIEFALQREPITRVLLDMNACGEIPERITHNDTKLNNLLIDDESGEAICVIDLDTVMPGLALYDFGDLVRTATSPVAEDEKDLSRVTLQMHMYKALHKGYLDSAGEFLSSAEKSLLSFAGKLMTFETGIRFLTDYLEGDVYFKTHRNEHNLDRCRNQFKLVASIEENETAMNRLSYGD